MRIWPRRAAVAGPQTCVGQWLCAALLRQLELRDRLRRTLNGGKEGWNYDEPAVVEAASELAIIRFFGTDYDAYDISGAVSWMRDVELARNKTPHGQMEMEAVIRSALGEGDVDLSGIIPPVLFEIRAQVVAYVVLKLGLPEADVVRMIVQAEQMAFDRDWHPPLAN